MMNVELRGTARGEVPARLIDMSEGGARVALALPLAVGAIHDFALPIEGHTVWVQGEVRRSERSGQGEHHVAIEFIGIDPGDRRLLQQYLARTGA